jgi:tRNA threonylcarbamoyl adenosine modification protein YeaZ
MILAIETSTPDASVALFDSVREEVIWQSQFTSDRAHNAVIFQPLEEALEVASDLEAVVVGIGPGSYSGVRVGIAVANGVSLARGVPCFGISSLAALPTVDAAKDYRVIGDARRGEFFLIEVCGRKPQGEAAMMSAERLAKQLKEADDELAIYTLEQSVVARFGEIEVQLLRPTAVELARRASMMAIQERVRLANLPLEPIYLRAPHITVAKKKKGCSSFGGEVEKE